MSIYLPYSSNKSYYLLN